MHSYVEHLPERNPAALHGCFSTSVMQRPVQHDAGHEAAAVASGSMMLGRPWVWALAAQGQTGVTRLLAHWRRELLLTMTLAGVSRIADITPSHLITPQERP